MKIPYNLGKHSQIIELSQDESRITNVWCTCEDFMYRQLEKVDSEGNPAKPEEPHVKIRVKELCKHLKQIHETFLKDKKLELRWYVQNG